MAYERRVYFLLFFTLAACAACSENADPTSPPYEPVLPTSWAGAVTNQFFPLVPGTVWEYRGETDNGTETIRVEVLAQTRLVNGVTATVVRDRVYLKGALIEDTHDWYAQDDQGNVWYLGEESYEIENGVPVSTEGSWEWGRDGALPGVIMWANPAAHIGEEYRQEFYKGEAEDWGKVLSVNESVTVPFGNFTNCVKTEDWNGLEGRSESLELKYYCPNIGTVLEVKSGAPSERVQLITRSGI